MPQPFIRHGFGAVRPYVYGYPDLIDLLVRAFGAVVLEQVALGSGYHVELRIGDAVVVVEAADPPPQGGRPNSIYVYVSDVDAAYARALAAGARAVSPPADKPYGERSCELHDSYGNIWYVSTYVGAA